VMISKYGFGGFNEFGQVTFMAAAISTTPILTAIVSILILKNEVNIKRIQCLYITTLRPMLLLKVGIGVIAGAAGINLTMAVAVVSFSLSQDLMLYPRVKPNPKPQTFDPES